MLDTIVYEGYIWILTTCGEKYSCTSQDEIRLLDELNTFYIAGGIILFCDADSECLAIGYQRYEFTREQYERLMRLDPDRGAYTALFRRLL